VWQAFFDESGDREHSPVLVLGGFLAPYVQWHDFREQWKLMLGNKPDIENFKMNEAQKLRGQFLGWSEKDRDERVRLAYRTIEDHVSFQVSCIVDIEALDKIVPKEELGRRKCPNPYYVAFAAIITKIIQYQRTIGVSEKIDFIFDERVMEKSQIVDGWESFKANTPIDMRDLLERAPAFENDKDLLPLQAADLLAWWVRKMATEEADKVPRVGFPWRPNRPIPGLQIHCDEAWLVAARDAIISSRQGGASA
jgi:Protein of unknown function (DUF3800)